MAVRFLSVLLLGLAGLVHTGCGGGSPTAPAPTPPPATAPQPPPVQGTGAIEITIVPNPVKYSGQPVTDDPACANRNNTWYYEQVIKEVGGADVVLTNRVDTFDGWPVYERSNLDIKVPAKGEITIKTRWCSASASEHNAHTTFSGKDSKGNPVQATGGVVRLLKP